jgi:hypothetical protein
MRLNLVDDRKGKPPLPSPAPDTSSAAERRRIARVVHDDRGNAKVEWQSAPADYERTTLAIDEAPVTRKPEEGYNPYGGTQARLRSKERRPPSGKRDLHKLSEWIKKMRELEERKKRGDGED